MPDFSVESLAEDTLLLRFGDVIDATVNARVHAAARALRDANLPGIVDIAPAYASLLLRFRFEKVPGTISLVDTLRDAIGRDTAARSVPGTLPRCIDVPVCYGGTHGPDLGEVAAHACMTADEAVACHTAGEYTVAMLGFAPGFPYLLGLDPALQLPRRADPRTRVPAGSVAIGGAQTGIYPRALPGGWQLIGRTPLVLFDPKRDPPCLLAPGDRVRFHAIDAGNYARLAEPVA